MTRAAYKKLSMVLVIAGAAGIASAQTTKSSTDVYKVNYFANNVAIAPDATLRIDNPGLTYGDLCAMLYVFDNDQQLTECCGCVQPPNDLRTLSVGHNLTSNPLTGRVSNNGVIKIVAAAVNNSLCDPTSNVIPTANLRAWETHIGNPVGTAYPITETESSDSTLGTTELASLQAQCAFVNMLGSGHGICTCGSTVTVSPKLASISVTGPPSVMVGQTQQFTATATVSDGSTANVSSTVSWSSSNTGVATVSSSGLVKGISAGSANISASLSGVSGLIGLTVTEQSALSFSVVTSIGPTVPSATSGKITTFFDAKEAVPVGATISADAQGAIPLLLAGDENGNPFLLGVGNTDGIVDANTTSIGLVRIALGLVYSTAPLTSDVLSSLITSSSNYPPLLSAVNQTLSGGQSPFDSDTVVQATWMVASDVLDAYQKTAPAVAKASIQPMVSTSSPIDVGPPLPIYLIPNLSATWNVWIDDSPGTNDIFIFDQMFIAWEADTHYPDGTTIGTAVTPPLSTTLGQLLAYYGGSASKTLLKGAAPDFVLTLSQSSNSKTQNVLNAIFRYYFFVTSAASGVIPSSDTEKCIVGSASNFFNPKLASLLSQPTGDAAITYLDSVLAFDVVYKSLSSCNQIPSIKDIFGATIDKLWKRLSLVKGFVSAGDTVAQTFYYWDYSSSFQVCKSNGQIAPCVITGLWSGSYTWDPPNGQTVSFALCLHQNGTSVTGNGDFSYPDFVNGEIGFTGTVSQDHVSLDAPDSQSPTGVAYTIDAIITGKTMSGTIVSLPSPSEGRGGISGKLTLTSSGTCNW